MKFVFVIFTELDGNSPFAWTNIGYLISSIKRLETLEIDVKFYNINEFDKAINEIKSLNIAFIGIPLLQRNLISSLKFCREIKKYIQNVKIIIGNIYASYFYREIMQDYPEIDFAVIGEGEETLYELCENLIKGRDVINCKGIAFNKNNKIFQTNKREVIEDIDKITFPDRSFTNEHLNTYFVLASRGCQGNCTFCDANSIYKNNKDNKLRSRSIDNVIKEIQQLKKDYNCKIVNFTDSTFCNNDNPNERLFDLYNKISSNKLEILFYMNLRCDQIQKETVESLIKLSNIGLTRLFLGLESANDDDLKLYGKNTNEKQIQNAFDFLKNSNLLGDNAPIEILTGFICFNPYTTVEKLYKNADFFRKNNLMIDLHQLMSRLELTPTSTITKKIKNDGLLTTDLNYLMVDIYPYRFQNNYVQDIYDLLIYCSNKLKYERYNRFFLYYKFWKIRNPDISDVDEVKKIYDKCIKMINEAALNIFFAVIDVYKKSNKIEIVDKLINYYNGLFNGNYQDIDFTGKKLAIYFKRHK